MSYDDVPWSPLNMVARLHTQAKRLGKSVTACMDEGGVDEKTLRTIKKGNSPTLATLTRLASGFGISLGQVLGIEPLDPAELEPTCDTMIMQAALATVEAALPPTARGKPLIMQIDTIAALTAEAYSLWAAALKADPDALSNEGNRAVVIESLKSALKRGASSGS